jgi:hypothetical protein
MAQEKDLVESNSESPTRVSLMGTRIIRVFYIRYKFCAASKDEVQVPSSDIFDLEVPVQH